MAKVKGMAATKYIGSLGPQVFYMRNGQNIVREKAASVSNPQTEAQMNQRVKWGNVINLYRLNKAWMEKYAFPLRPAKQSVYNAFMSINISGSNVALTKAKFQQGVTILAPLDFTKGSLPQMLLTYEGSIPGFVSDVEFSGAEEADTIGTITSTLLENNSWLRDGDQLSIIFNSTDSQGLQPKVVAFEITLDSNSNVIWNTTAFSRVCLADEGSFPMKMAFCIDELPTGFVAEGGVVGAVFVVSRKTANGIEVTTSRMELNTYALLNLYNSPAAQRAARRSYGGNDSEPFLIPNETEGVESVTIVEVNGVAPSSSVTLTQTKISPMTIRLSKDFSEIINDRKLFIQATYYDEVEGEEQSFQIIKDVTDGTPGVSYNGNLMTIAASCWNDEGMWPNPSEPVGAINPFSIRIEFNGGVYSAEADYKHLTE